MNIPVSSNQYLAIGCKEHGCARKVLQELVDSQRAEIERLRQYEPLKGGTPLPEFRLRAALNNLLTALDFRDSGERLFATYGMAAIDAANAAAALLRDGCSPAETSAWQSIETAPKDGRTVLVKSGNWVVTAHWHPSQCWATCGPSYEPIPSDEQPEKWAPIPEGGPSENG